VRSSVSRRTGLPLFLALAATAILPITALGGDAAALGATQALRAGVSPASGPISYGTDGRLTVLLLGSDYRPGLYGERTDVVMVMSIDPNNGRIAAASIPRDMIYIPHAASNGGGNSGTTRINALYPHYRKSFSTYKLPKVDMHALKEVKADVATLLSTEIDYVVLVRFTGFTKLMDVIGGVNVSIPNAIRDSYYQAPGENHGVKGVYFPKSTTTLWHLTGTAKCQPYPAKCHNGLAYARSRHGSVGTQYNSDFQRARRQQFLVKAGADRVVQLGTGNLSSLVTWVQEPRLYTDMPRTLDAANQMYNLVNGAHLLVSDTVVFSPSKWAKSDSTTPIYTFRPKLPAIRTWINQHFGS
jgi:anionic cell wall polymer biosynthesis LytR-Cps2A-Psr (LCP) family protein